MSFGYSGASYSSELQAEIAKALARGLDLMLNLPEVFKALGARIALAEGIQGSGCSSYSWPDISELSIFPKISLRVKRAIGTLDTTPDDVDQNNRQPCRETSQELSNVGARPG